ncbi:MAG: hypothetical protein ACXAB2_14615 [Candidatus Hodarchaeales archaeon]|jgi:hypothetical protein
MLYLIYWELNESCSPSEITKVGMKIAELGDVEGAENLSWVVTPDYWGITLLKVESEEAAFTAVSRWRIAMPGVFKSWKGALAMEVEKAMPFIMSQAEALGK